MNTKTLLSILRAAGCAAALAAAAGCCTCGGRRTAATPGDAVAAGSPVFVLCRFDLKPGQADAYAEAVKAVTDAVRREKGCRFYSLVGDAETGMPKQQKFGADVLWMIECWDSVEDLKAHLETPHMKAFGPVARPLRQSGTFHVLSER